MTQLTLYIEELKGIFQPVADKIGQGAEFGWEVVLRQQIAYGMIAVFVALLGLIGMILLEIAMKKVDKDSDLFFGEALGFVVALVMFIAGIINAILRLYNPAYYALQFFVNLVK